MNASWKLSQQIPDKRVWLEHQKGECRHDGASQKSDCEPDSTAHEGPVDRHLDGKAAKIPLCAGCKQPRQGPVWFDQKGLAN